MKNRIFKINSLFILTILLLNCTGFGEDKNLLKNSAPVKHTLKIASFNIQIFGKKKLARPNTLSVLAEIAANFDIIALQEIGSNRSTASAEECAEIMEAFTAKINGTAAAGTYRFICGDQYAVIYRSGMVKLKGFTLYDGGESLSYTPLIANFETTGSGHLFDFTLVTVHTSPKLARSEIAALKTVIKEAAELYSEPDVICLGDFNADGTYYDEGESDWLSGFDPDRFITGIPNSYDTTVAESDNTYDRIQMTLSLESDYTGKSGVLRFGELYDVTGCEGGKTTSGTEKAVSDHYPVWCEYYTDRDRD